MNMKLIKTVAFWLVVAMCIELGLAALIGPVFSRFLPAIIVRVLAIAAGVAAAYLGFLEVTAKKGKK